MGAATPPIQVVVSKETTCTLHENEINTIHCWGRGDYGQLGSGNTNDLYQPPCTPIAFHDEFIPKSITCGSHHCCTVSTVNSAICWGYGYYGRLGQGSHHNIGDCPHEMGNNLTEIDLGTDFSVDHISCGGRHSCALSTSNELKCFGSNKYGQLGIGSTEDIGDEINEMGDNLMTVDLGSDFIPIRVECGGYFTCVISSKFELKCFGRNEFGELGIGDINHRGDSIDEMGDNLNSIDLGTGFMVSSVRCGEYHICALSTTQSIKCFGSGKFGRLGLGDVENRGDDPSEMGDYLETVDLGIDFVAQSVGTGGYYSFAVSTEGALKAWGYGERLGYGTMYQRGNEPNETGDYLPEVDLGGGLYVTHLSDGSLGDHTCVLLSDGSISGLKCYGRNMHGQLGLADTENRGDGPNEMGDHLPFIDGYEWTENPTNSPTNNPTLEALPISALTSDSVNISSIRSTLASPKTTHSEIMESSDLIFIAKTDLIFIAIITGSVIVLILACTSVLCYVRNQRAKSDGSGMRQKDHMVLRAVNSASENIMQPGQMYGIEEIDDYDVY